ncbi:MAG: hypothetical protein ABSA34_03520 [Candidatus Goldiibacteriota bacterium]
MDVIERIRSDQNSLVAWRHDIHAHPELGFEELRVLRVPDEADDAALRLLLVGIDPLPWVGDDRFVLQDLQRRVGQRWGAGREHDDRGRRRQAKAAS